jgi:hypothetical protein
MLRHESYPFFEMLLMGKRLERIAGATYSIERVFSTPNDASDANEQLRDLLDKASVEDAAKRDRLIGLDRPRAALL